MPEQLTTDRVSELKCFLNAEDHLGLAALRGPLLTGRARRKGQPSALASKANAANSGSSLEMNSPSYSCRKPRPMAAPRLASAGKQAAQPIAETTAPSAPVLSTIGAIGFMASLRAQRLTLDG